MPALRFYHGPMDCGKSTLALQIAFNHQRAGRSVTLLTHLDRSGQGRISSRLGVESLAREFSPASALAPLLTPRPDLAIVDEAQFLSPLQVEELAYLVDHEGLDVFAFGITSDFRSELFPGSARLLEIADEVLPLQVSALCWCGAPGRMNARIQEGHLVTEGERILQGDTDEAPVSYRVLCRRHFFEGRLA